MTHSFRTKFAWAFISSLVLSALGLSLLWTTAGILHRHQSFRPVLDFFSVFPGIPVVVAITGVTLFIVTFMAATQPTVRYLDEIVQSLQQMEKGDWSHRIPLRHQDEFTMVAESANRMAAALGQSISDIKQAEQARSDLVTSVSHDLRTPLTVIIGYLGLIVDKSNRSETDRALYASIAHQKALKMKELIDELFEYTRLNYGGVRKSSQLIDLWDLIAQVVEELYPLIQDSGMECRLPTQMKIPLTADGTLLARAFENLFVNALRYGKQGHYIDVEFEETITSIVVRIRNYGLPIPEKDLTRIFDRFYRVDNARSSSTGGSGLGLAIVKSIVELHDGRIRATSNSHNTCFEVELPKAEDLYHIDQS